MMLFVWEEELLGERVACISSVILQKAMGDIWVWSLHVSHCYTIRSAYYYLTSIEDNNHQNNIKFLWLKVVPLKCLFLLGDYFSIRFPQRII